jgi:hypothetical protein
MEKEDKTANTATARAGTPTAVGVRAQGTPTVGAFGSTFVLAPAWSLRMGAEDPVLMPAFCRVDGMAIYITAELQLKHTPALGSSDELQRRQALQTLSADAARVRDEDNAGGSSMISECMSMDVLHRAFGARLLKTEMELEYWPRNGAITDFSVGARGTGSNPRRPRGLEHADSNAAAGTRVKREGGSGGFRRPAPRIQRFSHPFPACQRCPRPRGAARSSSACR